MDALDLQYQPPKHGKVMGTLTATLGNDRYVDQMNLTKNKTRETAARTLVERWPALKFDEVKAELDKLAAQSHTVANGQSASSDSKNSEKTSEELLGAMPKDIRDEALAMLEDPDLFKRVVVDIAALGVAGERETTATMYLVGVSRLLDQPLSARVHGPSSSGKNYVIEQPARLFPSEAVILATQMTPQALFHMPPGSLRHKFIVSGERSRLENDDRTEATRALREMQSSGRLFKLMPVKEGGQIVTQLIEQEGRLPMPNQRPWAKCLMKTPIDASRCTRMSDHNKPDASSIKWQKNIAKQIRIRGQTGSSKSILPYSGR